MDKAILYIVYRNGISLKIPFKKLEDLDVFTMLFSNIYELSNSLAVIFNLDISRDDVYGGNVIYLKKKKKNKKIVEIDKPIRFISDQYEFDDLKDRYCQFFVDDRNRIKNIEYGLCYIEHDAVKNFVSGKNVSITDYDIRRAVDAYFEDGYLKKRDAYFTLKFEEYISSKKHSENDVFRQNNLNSFDIQDEYFEYLRDYANLGEEEYAKAMDILSGYDSDEIRRNMVNSQYGVFDGARQNYIYEDSDKYRYIVIALEALSGHSLQEIINMANFYENKKGFGKR